MKSLYSMVVVGIALVTFGCTQATEDVKSATEEAGNAAADAMDKAGDAAGEAMDAAGDAAGETMDAAGDAVDATGDAAGDAVDAAGDAASDAVDAAKDAAEGLMSAVKDAADKASAELDKFDGGSDVLKNVTGFFSSAGSAMSGITDGDTANAAKSKFDEVGAMLDKIGDSVADLPEEAKSALATVVDKGTEGLKALGDKALAIPGVSDVIKPKVDELMNKLSDLRSKL